MFGCVEIGNSTNRVGEKCSDGLYLYTNVTLSDTPEVITAGVADGSLVDPRLTNNPMTKQGESGGDACHIGGNTYGCEKGEGSEDSSSIVSYLTENPTGLNSTFTKCTRCYSLNSAGENGSGNLDSVVCSDGIQPVDSSSCGSCSLSSNGDAYGDGGCQSCSSGYYLGTDSSCTKGFGLSNGARCLDTQCLKGKNGYSNLVSGCTLGGFGQSYYKGDCADGQDSSEDSIFDTGNRCHKDLIYQPYLTNLSDVGCVTACNKNQYVSYNLLSDIYGFIYDQRTGVNGENNNCYEGAGPSNNECKSGLQGYYLVLNDNGGNLGTGTQMSNTTSTINLFVTPREEPDTANGSYELPYGHIAKALKASEDLSSEYTDAIVNIYLLSGDHFMTRNINHYHYDSG